jgi:hypothetical protein
MPILRDKGSKVCIGHTSYPYSRYTVKKVSGFPIPSRDVTYQTLAWNNLIIPGHGEFEFGQ